MPERPNSSSSSSYRGTVVLIAWREFRHTALTTGFIFGAVAMPVLMFGVIALIPMLITNEVPPLVGEIAIVDPSETILPRAKVKLETPPTREETIEELTENPPTDTGSRMEAASELASGAAPQRIEVAWRSETALESIDALKEHVKNGSLLAAALITPDMLDPTKDAIAFEYYIPTSLSPKHVNQISRAIRKSVEDERIKRSGLDAAALGRLTNPPDPNTTRISPEGGESEENTELRFLVPGAFMMLLWICVFTSANYLLTTTIEEKSNKVMEVLLAATSPMQLLSGKIMGYAMVSIVMLVMYGGLGLAGLSAAAMMDLVPTMHLVYLAVFFVMASVMVSAMMAAVGSAVSDLREAQSLVGPVMMLLIVPLMLWMPIVQNPNGALATIASFIPPASPFVMILRLTAAMEPIPIWQTVLSIAWGFACAYGMLWGAARIFRIGVLMQGKPPTPRELVKWAFVR